MTPLMQAACRKRPSIMRLLLALGNPAEQTMAVDSSGRNALMHTAEASSVECMQILLKAHDPKAQASALDLSGRSALTQVLTASYGIDHENNVECLHLLLDLEPSQEQLDLAFERVTKEYLEHYYPPLFVKVIERLLRMGAKIPDGDHPGLPDWKEALRPIVTNLLRPSRQEDQVNEARARLEEAQAQLNEAVVETLKHRSIPGGPPAAPGA